MLKRIICIILLTTIAVSSIRAQWEYETASELSASRKGVRTSTDVMLGVMPAATLGIALYKHDWKGIGIAAGECAGSLVMTYGLKYIVKKRRPDGSDMHSFPSGHSALVFADASFVMRRYGWKFGVPAYALATYVAWGRTYAKKHDFWDVAAGAAIGSAVGLIFTTPFAREHNLQLTPQITTDPVDNTFISVGVGGSMTF